MGWVGSVRYGDRVQIVGRIPAVKKLGWNKIRVGFRWFSRLCPDQFASISG